MNRTECVHHPQPEYRECHHVGDRYVAVFWGTGGFGGKGWLCRSGVTGRRGSITAWADKELQSMLDELRGVEMARVCLPGAESAP